MAPQLQQLGCSKKRFCGVCGVVLRPTDERAGRMPTVQGNDVTVSAKIHVRGPLVWSKAVVAVGEIKKKRGAGRLPVFSFSVCRRLCRRHRRRRAPQKRCVNGCQNSRPGGVILPPLPCTSQLQLRFYSRAAERASEIFARSQRETANHRGALLATVRRISVPATT